MPGGCEGIDRPRARGARGTISPRTMLVVVFEMDTLPTVRLGAPAPAPAPPSSPPPSSGAAYVCIVRTASSALKDILLLATVSCRSRVQTIVWLILFLNLS